MKKNEFADRRGFLKSIVGAIAAPKAAAALPAPKISAVIKHAPWDAAGAAHTAARMAADKFNDRESLRAGLRGVRNRIAEHIQPDPRMAPREMTNWAAKARVMSLSPKGGWSKDALDKRVKNTMKMSKAIRKQDQRRLAVAAKEVADKEWLGIAKDALVNKRAGQWTVQQAGLDSFKRRLDKKPHATKARGAHSYHGRFNNDALSLLSALIAAHLVQMDR